MHAIRIPLHIFLSEYVETQNNPSAIYTFGDADADADGQRVDGV